MTSGELIASAREWQRDKSSGWLINKLADEIERLLVVEEAAVSYAETVEALTNGSRDRVLWAIKAQPERIRALHALVRNKLLQ
jgi:hypothetical protein